VSLACSRPDTSCVCGAFGIDCAQPDGDVVTWLAGDYLYWEAQTQKGEKLTSQVEALLESCDEAPVEEAKAAIHAICDKLPLKDLDLSAWGADAAQTNFDSPLWEQLYKPCLACGTCTFVCPTCQCYDIKDYNTGNGVQRYRCWDSCMYSDFTMMAHGNNRNSQMQRFRQRFMHKLAYFPANNDGMFSCVGCGRCVDSCPAHLNIVKVIKAFGKEEK
jgi:heterodisulfide reductase subunit C